MLDVSGYVQSEYEARGNELIIKTNEEFNTHTFLSHSSHIGTLTRNKVLKRLISGKFILFLLLEESNTEIAASYWAYISNGRSWYDSLQIESGDVILCNAFVEPKYRSRGYYTQLVTYCHNTLVKMEKINRIYTIVERSNRASDYVNRTFYGDEYYVNTLIKLLGLNILSILSREQKRKVFLVPAGYRIL